MMLGLLQSFLAIVGGQYTVIIAERSSDVLTDIIVVFYYKYHRANICILSFFFDFINLLPYNGFFFFFMQCIGIGIFCQ